MGLLTMLVVACLTKEIRTV